MDSSQLRTSAKAKHDATIAALEEELHAQKQRAGYDDEVQAAKGKKRVAAIEKEIARLKKAGPEKAGAADDEDDA